MLEEAESQTFETILVVAAEGSCKPVWNDKRGSLQVIKKATRRLFLIKINGQVRKS